MNQAAIEAKHVLTSLVILLLYMPAVAVVYRLMFPNLTRLARSVLQGFLLFHALVVGLKVFVMPDNDFIRWILVSGWENNVPGAFAATQMITACFVAFLAAWLARNESTLKRLYLILIGIGFCGMTLDEYFELWRLVSLDTTAKMLGYAALGLPLAIAIIASALRSRGSARVWDLSLLAGFFITAFSAIVVDELPAPCFSIGAPLTDGCLVMTHIEESLEMLGVWLALAGLLGQLSDIAPDPAPRLRTGLRIAPPLIFALLMLHIVLTAYGFDELRRLPHRLVLKFEVASLAQPSALRFEGGVHVHGFEVSKESDLISVQLYSSSARRDNRDSGYSLHLVDQDRQETVASQDKHWCCPSQIQIKAPVCEQRCKPHRILPDWLLYEPLYRQRLELKPQPGAPSNRAYWLVLTHWREDGENYRYQNVLSSDLPRLGATQVILGEFVLHAGSRQATSPPLAAFSNGFALESHNLPRRAPAGEALSIDFTWRANEPGGQDFIQFLHLGHEETGEWLVYDQQPLGPRLPTRLWYKGLADSETWTVPLPADLAPGSYAVYTGLYRAADQMRVPAVAEDGQPWRDARVLLGSIRFES